MKKIYALFIIAAMIYGPLKISAAERDSIDFKRNIIRWNLTPLFVVGFKSFVFGYERVLKNNTSFSINAGYLEKAPMEDQEGNPIKLFDQSSRGGFDITADFRFYFKKRNKYPAPDGLYWGPYAGYYTLWQDASLNLLDNGNIKNTVFYDARLQMTNIGIQLGYQFVFKRHITIDLILIGPSLTFYNLNMGLKFQTDIDPDDPFYSDLMDFLEGNNGFLAEFIRNQSFNASGRLKFKYYGFRYGVQLGYNF